MESISIGPRNVTQVARFILTMQFSHILDHTLRQWLESRHHLQEVRNHFLEPKALLPGETLIDYMDRSLSTLIKCVRHMLNQLPAQQHEQLLTSTPFA